MDPLIGRIISHYKIVERIGAGGMGVVYKAEDTKLGRTVALKFLPPEWTRDGKAKARFIQEARAASAMDHSNICTIFEIEETDDEQIFISMAYYHGKTLKEKIAEGPMDPAEIAAIGAQIAQGLATAHANGIVHRDIKPGNIFVMNDGLVKIVDFGLAKLAGQLKLTSTGRTMGTVSYMSPEQCSGAEAGPAADIWALGVILYEMATGTPPFKGDYDAAMMYSIMHQEPERLGAIRPDAPEELEYIAMKALAKNPAERYRDANEMLSDLNALRRRLDRGEPPPRNAWMFRRAERRLYIVIAAAVVAVAAAAVFWRLSSNEKRRAGDYLGQPRQITSGSFWHGEPALSPDGSRIAFASDESGNKDIYIMGVRGGPSSRLTSDPAADFYPAWFPDGTAIAFVSDRTGAESIWRTDQFGGGAVLLLPNAVDPAVSPQGEWIAFSTIGPDKQMRIGIAPLANPDRITLLTGEGDGLWGHRYPAWSPDGLTICYATQNDLWTVPASGGKARPLSKGGERDSNPAWATSGRHLFFSSRREGTLALWRIAAAGGKPERFTWGTGYDHDPSISTDGSRLAYSTQTAHAALCVRNLITGKEAPFAGPWDEYMACIAPDGAKVVFSSARFGKDLDLWVQPLADGAPAGEPQRLTDETGHASHPVVSPDGKWLAYYLVRGDERDVYTLPATGGQPIRFTDDPANDLQPAWSPDGGSIAFVSERGGGFSIWVAPVENGRPAGEPKRITDKDILASAPAWSPDGGRIAFVGFKDDRSEVWTIAADGSSEANRITSGADARRVRWDHRSGDILASGSWGSGDISLHRVSLERGESTPLIPSVVFGYKSASALFDVSWDGRLLVYAREEHRGDIWVFESKKGTF